MWSPGQAHLHVPRTFAENKAWRKRAFKRGAQSQRFRQKEWERCAGDFLYYINTYVMTYDPEAPDPVVPLITWPAQERALRKILWCAEARRDCVIEKSRRQGGSWISLLAMEAIWHFHKLRQFLLVSRSSLMVDGKTPDALFWKLDFMHQRLPEWLMPRGWEPGKHRNKNYLENPQLGGVVTGQATSEKSGVGGRAYVMFVDEFSRIDEDQELLESTRDTCKCRVFNSTHTGTGTAFYRLCQRPDMEKVHLHWSENPHVNEGLYHAEANKAVAHDGLYQYPLDYLFVLDGSPTGGPYPGLRSPWYDREERERGSRRDVATNLDIDASGSTTQFFDALKIRLLMEKYVQAPYWQGDVQYDPKTAKPVALVERAGGPLKLWLNLSGNGKPPMAKYSIGWDVAQGTGSTPSCGIGFNDLGDQVFEYASATIEPGDLAYVAAALGWLFQDAGYIAARQIFEMQGPGRNFGGGLIRLGYSSLYFNTTDIPKSRKYKVSDIPGWDNNAEEMLELMIQFRTALYYGKIMPRSELMLRECLQFRYTSRGDIEHSQIESKDDPSGARVSHADRAIAAALGWKECAREWARPAEPEKPQPFPRISLQWRRQLHEDRMRDQESA